MEIITLNLVLLLGQFEENIIYIIIHILHNKSMFYKADGIYNF